VRTVVWFRGKDLRLADHAPLRAAVAGGEVVPLFVLDPVFFAPERARPIAHRIQFLLESLAELADGIVRLGSRLVVVRGAAIEVVPELAARWKADRVVAQAWVAPFARERDRRVGDALRAAGIAFDLFGGETLHPPGTLRTGGGGPYAVFTAFARAFARDAVIDPPEPAPRRLPRLPADVRTRSVALPPLASLGIEHNAALPPGGERAGRERLGEFIAGAVARYRDGRDRMDLPGTSRLSADLKFGTLSPRTVWTRVAARVRDAHVAAYLNELVWREFAHSTLYDRPDLLVEPFRPEWKGFPWRADERGWRAWVDGTTGYPVVDAAARQLLGEGFVHNRARMIAASFLAKHLLVDFRRGEAHYLALLVDGDWANNDLGWQWSTGCGCDAQPYFRVFNPVSQGERFDPDGTYVRRWVPELARLDTKWIHAPWTAPPAVLARAGITLGTTYPAPIVDHALARARFLDTAKAHLQQARASVEPVPI
jgi:deoxyribodipyrimidine photo-lyase